jgi:hypothetical protein
MDILQEQFPKTLEWIESLAPFIIIRGDHQVIVKFSDGRHPLLLSHEKIEAFENRNGNETFLWGDA